MTQFYNISPRHHEFCFLQKNIREGIQKNLANLFRLDCFAFARNDIIAIVKEY